MIPGPQEVYGAVDARFPFSTAYDWDNSGWQIQGTRDVSRCLVALDPSKGVAAAAVEQDAQLIITHHPLYFPHLTRIDPDSSVGGVTRSLLEKGVGLISSHTPADRHLDGVSGALADALGLQQQEILAADEEARYFKLVTFAPEEAVEDIRRALVMAGAGRIGNYVECSFTISGMGSFRPVKGARPAVGTVGDLELVEEQRLEMRVPADRVEDALDLLRATHPYDEVAFDLYPTFRQGVTLGVGVIGVLPDPMPREEALARVKERLGGVPLRVTGPLEGSGTEQETVEIVAAAGGSTSEFIGVAAARGAHLFVGGDLKYHDLLEGAGRMICVDPGHRASELPGVERLASVVQNAAAREGWKMEVSIHKEDPALSRVV